MGEGAACQRPGPLLLSLAGSVLWREAKPWQPPVAEACGPAASSLADQRLGRSVPFQTLSASALPDGRAGGSQAPFPLESGLVQFHPMPMPVHPFPGSWEIQAQEQGCRAELLAPDAASSRELGSAHKHFPSAYHVPVVSGERRGRVPAWGAVSLEEPENLGGQPQPLGCMWWMGPGGAEREK